MLENTKSIDWFEGQNIIPQELFLEALQIIIVYGYANADSALTQKFKIRQERHLDMLSHEPYYLDKHFIIKLGLTYLWRVCERHLFYISYKTESPCSNHRRDFLDRFKNFLHHPLVPGLLAVLTSESDFKVIIRAYLRDWQDVLTRLTEILRESLLDDTPFEDELDGANDPKTVPRFLMQFVGTCQFINRLSSEFDKFDYLALLYQDAESLCFRPLQ